MGCKKVVKKVEIHKIVIDINYKNIWAKIVPHKNNQRFETTNR
jgi:hypothetical protein